MSIDVSNISAPAGDAFKFESINDKIKGVITHAEMKDQVNKFTNKDETVLVITIETEDGESAKVYPRTAPGSQMARVISDAVVAAGQTSLEVGGTLAVQWTGEEDIGKGNPMKVYAAAYEAPKAQAGAVAASDLLG